MNGDGNNLLERINELQQRLSLQPDWAEGYFELGNLVQQTSTELFSKDAASCWARAFMLQSDWEEKYPHWGMKLRTIGEYLLCMEDDAEEYERLIKEYLAYLDRRAARNPLSALNFRFLSNNNSPEYIGHLIFEPDLFVKLGMLGWREPYQGVILCPGKVANRAILNYWKQYLHVVEDPNRVAGLQPFYQEMFYDSWYALLPGDRLCNAGKAMVLVEQEWQRQGRKPLLALTDDDKARGWETLKRLGVPEGSWFVTIHVREPGFHNENSANPTGAFRNGDITNYYPAIKNITDRGGWVVRLGDRSMRQLPPMERVIDLAHSPEKSESMDLFICTQCKFYLGTVSGPLFVPLVFGVPCAITNYAPMTYAPIAARDLYIPKLVWSERDKRYLTLQEQLEPPICVAHCDRLQQMGIRHLDNSSEEICELIDEMFLDVEGKNVYEGDDLELAQRVDKIINTSKWCTGGKSRMCKAFLRRYREYF